MAKIMLNSLQEKVSVILHDTTHLVTADPEHVHYCETCGQAIRPPEEYGKPRVSMPRRIGIGISIALHVLVLLYFIFHKSTIHIKPPQGERKGEMVYISPLPPQPKATPTITPQKQPTKVSKAAKSKPAPSVPKQSVAKATPAPTTQKQVIVPPVQATMTPPPVVQEDMSSMIQKRQQQRAAERAANAPPSDSAPAEESEGDRANRIARANIAGAQGATSGQKDDGGGVFSIVNKTFNRADIKFRGWNGNFKRTWSQQVTVERGDNPDIETAIVKRMVELIRQEKPGDFVWESHRLGRNVPMSARPADQAELEAFLLKEFFPNYIK